MEEVIKEISSLSDVKKLPPYVQELLRKSLESVSKIKLPIFTFKENNEWIAKTPLLDISAQGETEKEAVESIVDMIDDYMSDPYTKKPKIETMTHVNIQTVPIDLPVDNVAVNSSVKSR
ncbi:MAG: hypothetical protein HY365_03865 [Candidatus Aenigmarchaeota archaeon]|nr:hypothetical protein [Candidatus Aenigmarchaeota archaeon]